MQQPAPVSGEADAEPEMLDQPQAEFKLGESSSSRVDSVSTLSPVDDFQAMVQQGQLEDALEGLQKAIYTLVDTSLGDRYFTSDVSSLRVFFAQQNQMPGRQTRQSVLGVDPCMIRCCCCRHRCSACSGGLSAG